MRKVLLMILLTTLAVGCDQESACQDTVIEGVVVDAQTRTPLPDISYGAYWSFGIGGINRIGNGVTDAQGRFSIRQRLGRDLGITLSINGNTSIQNSYQVYRRQISSCATTTLTVELQPLPSP